MTTRQTVNDPDPDVLNGDDMARCNRLPPKLRQQVLGRLRDGLATAELRREAARLRGELFLEIVPPAGSTLDRAGFAAPQEGARP